MNTRESVSRVRNIYSKDPESEGPNIPNVATGETDEGDQGSKMRLTPQGCAKGDPSELVENGQNLAKQIG